MPNISVIQQSTVSPRDVLSAATSAALVDPKNQIIGQTDSLVRVSREARPIWTIVLAIIFFPLGLLFLLIKKQSVLTINAAPHGDGSLITVSGEGTKATTDSVRAYVDSVAARYDAVSPPT